LLASKPIINAKDIIEDIRLGMDDAQLMRKYKLTSKGLQSAFTKLINNRLMTVDEVYGQRRSDDEDTVIIDDMTLIQKHFLTVTAPVYEAGKPEVHGTLQEVTERGLTISGIESRIGEVKSFVVPCHEFLKIKEITFEAKCLWVKKKRTTKEWSAGFQITQIDKKNLGCLRELVKVLTLG
jgi:hypothetical protein